MKKEEYEKLKPEQLVEALVKKDAVIAELEAGLNTAKGEIEALMVENSTKIDPEFITINKKKYVLASPSFFHKDETGKVIKFNFESVKKASKELQAKLVEDKALVEQASLEKEDKA